MLCSVQDAAGGCAWIFKEIVAPGKTRLDKRKSCNWDTWVNSGERDSTPVA